MSEEKLLPKAQDHVSPAVDRTPYPLVAWVDPAPFYVDAGFNEDTRGWSKLDRPARESDGELTVGQIEDALASLTPAEAAVLVLLSKGFSADQIVWLMNMSVSSVNEAIFKAEDLIGVDILVKAGLISEVRRNTVESLYARKLAHNISCLVDARIMRISVEDIYCKLHVMLSNGQQAELWVCSDEQMEAPGWLSLELDDGQPVFPEDIPFLYENIRALVGERRSSREATRQILSDIVEKAVELIDHIDGCPDLEDEAEHDESEYWECERFEDQDEAPITLCPAYQTERQIRAVEADGELPDLSTSQQTNSAEDALSLDRLQPEIQSIIQRLTQISREIEEVPAGAQGFVRNFRAEEWTAFWSALESKAPLVAKSAAKFGILPRSQPKPEIADREWTDLTRKEGGPAQVNDFVDDLFGPQPASIVSLRNSTKTMRYNVSVTPACECQNQPASSTQDLFEPLLSLVPQCASS